MKEPSYIAYTFAQILNEMPPVSLRRFILPGITIVLGLIVTYLFLSL